MIIAVATREHRNSVISSSAIQSARENLERSSWGGNKTVMFRYSLSSAHSSRYANTTCFRWLSN